MKFVVNISPNGRLSLPEEALYPDYKNNYVAGVDILYSKETEELALEIYRIPLKNHLERDATIKELYTTLTVKRDNSINISPYFGKIGYFKLPTHDKLSTYEAYILDNYIIIKLNPFNLETAIPANFKRIVLERTRCPDEVSLSTCGLLSIPPHQVALAICGVDLSDQAARTALRSKNRRCSIEFDADTKTFHLHFTSGDRVIKQDATLSLQTLLKSYGIVIPKRLFLPYTLSGNTLSFCLTDKDPLEERRNLRQARKSLGMLY